ncbi:MAG: YbaB/EbfC family nucleoid-associated protein [Raineya sp.]|nr:YbaB/EbfC family nucleoid-associated protein [Raineya sp.]MDW8296198.1 YbaB/EbfC family nucleoid-associated protein [Raineya sp.]
MNFNLGDLMSKVKELQSKLQEAREGLKNISATAESGAGLVRVTVNGNRQVISIEIENELIKPEEKEMLQDLIVAAVNKAIQEVEHKIVEYIRQITGGIVPEMPNFDLGKFGF